MANNVLETRIAQKYDTLANWEQSTLVLMAGEKAHVSDKGTTKTGNGTDIFKDLPYDKAVAVDDADYARISVYDTDKNGSVDKADSIKSGDSFLVVDDTTNTGLWTAAKVESEVQNIKDNYIPATEKGSANGVATLDANGLVPASQLPSFVDDVIEVDTYADLPPTGEESKIYVIKGGDDGNAGKTFRWSGTGYAEISASVALGEVAGTAYEGSKGKANADAIAQLQADLGTLTGDVGQLGALAHKNTVGTVDIDNDAVTTDKILDANVTESKIADGAVTNAKLGALSVNDAKISNVNVNKLIQTDGEYLILSCGDATA